jgi:hypothetical protein
MNKQQFDKVFSNTQGYINNRFYEIKSDGEDFHAIYYTGIEIESGLPVWGKVVTDRWEEEGMLTVEVKYEEDWYRLDSFHLEGIEICDYCRGEYYTRFGNGNYCSIECEEEEEVVGFE